MTHFNPLTYCLQMKWKDIVADISSMSSEEAKSYMDFKKTDSYQLVDVRQPAEYSKSHLAGALLIPLQDLVEGKGDLNSQKPTIVYCKSGRRSLAASQWLSSKNFKEVYNLTGGISQWLDQKAFGHYDLNLHLIEEDARFDDVLSMAYAMEEGLRQFYLALAREASDESHIKLYRKLASFEVEHKQYLAAQYSVSEGKAMIEKEEDKRGGQIMEGGGYAHISLIKSISSLDKLEEVFDLSIALETQSFDFYVRMAGKTVDPQLKKFYLEMADEEKKHIKFLSAKMDEYLEK